MANPYSNQRPKVVPPHVSIGLVRVACHLTLDEVCARVAEATGEPFLRGSLSAIENGHRGASAAILEALEAAYGLPAGSINTQYEPRVRAA